MRRALTKIKPASGFSHLLHNVLVVLLPAIVFVFVRIDLIGLALAVILLSKWRMLAVKPRHWPANIRANGVDLIAGLSFLVFIVYSDAQITQLIWAFIYGLWLLLLKPRSNTLGVSVQAVLGQFLGLSALFLYWGDAPSLVLVAAGGVVCYLSARHFFASFDEIYARFLAHTWSYFAAALIWILSHWLLFYGNLAQPTLLLSVIGFGCAGLYYLEQTDKLSLLLRRQLVFVMAAIVIIVLAFSDWGDKTV